MSASYKQLGLFCGEWDFPAPDTVRIRKVEQLAIKAARSYGLKVSSVKWKNNRRVMASIGKGGVLNIHRIYQRAEKPDLLNLAVVMSGKAKPKDLEHFKKYIERNMPIDIGEGKSNLVVLPPRGLFHDLDKAFERVVPLLGKRPKPIPTLGWTRASAGITGITWGTHRETPEGSLILVNAVLDAHDIPSFVVDHIIWHELCHQVLPPEEKPGHKRVVHHKAFREMEERFPRLKQAEKWELDNVMRLIRKYKRKRR